jgi:serine/threonine-protein kinase
MQSIQKIDSNRFVGRQIGTATIIKEIARGGMAIVFIAYQRTLKRQIAIKLLPVDHMTDRTAELFQTEAEAAAILSHPNIIQIYEVGKSDEFLFFTMQLIQGTTLSTILNKIKNQLIPSRRVLPAKKTIEIIIQILDALEYAHHNDVIHMDIKPHNILFEKHTRRPLISDFGVARVLRTQNNSSQITGGSPLYMAPEQIIGSSIDGRIDVFATGIMLFQMLVPSLPMRPYSSHEALLEDKLLNRGGVFLKKPSELNLTLHRSMDQIVSTATAYEPERRYQTCRDFIQDLENYKRRFLWQ